MPSQARPKRPGPEKTRQANWKKRAARFKLSHKAYVASVKSRQQLLKAAAPKLKEQFGLDLAEATAASRKAFEEVAAAAAKL